MLIADGEARARAAVEVVVRETGLLLSVVGHAATATELVERTHALAPHILVLEPRLPGAGFDALAELRRDNPALHVIVLTRSELPGRRARARAPRDGLPAQAARAARLRAALAVAVEALDPPEDALPPLPAPAADERVCAFALPDRAVLHRLADEGLAVTAGPDHAAVTIRPGTDDLERVRRSVRPPLGLSAPFDPLDPRPGAPDALAALAAGYFAGDEVRFEDLPAQDEPYPLELERELLRAITVGDTGAALGHLAALSDALTRPVRSPASAATGFATSSA